MTLEALTNQLQGSYFDWAVAHQSELNRIADQPTVQSRVAHLIEQAIEHPLTKTGSPITSVRVCLQLSNFASLKLGILIGLLLDKPTQSEPAEPNDAAEPWVAEPQEAEAVAMPPQLRQSICPSCLQSGEVCHDCGQPKVDCTCGIGRFSPVVCLTCEGSGIIEQ